MEILLDAIQARVLGSLMEKESTTPEYYPLSLNALVNACNQKSSREPVMELAEHQVRTALYELEKKGLAETARGTGRVSKYQHRLQEVLNLRRGESSLLCLLLLRGPQTVGELRGRSERMHRFEEIEDVQSALDLLAQREPALVALLARQPGTKEPRWTHLLSGVPVVSAVPADAVGGGNAGDENAGRIAEEISSLREQVARLDARVDALEAKLNATDQRPPQD